MRRIIPALAAATVIAIPAGVTAWASAAHPSSAPASSAVHATATPTPTHAQATATARAKATVTAKAHATATARAKATATARAKATAVAATAKSVTVQGPSVDMNWGPVQVTIVVKGKKLVNVSATAPMERSRSNYINSQAIPWLNQETLKAQNANIDLIGGATLTSEAYAQSLQAALQQAHL